MEVNYKDMEKTLPRYLRNDIEAWVEGVKSKKRL
ncbi:hypothetical protein HMPREF0491_01084 [Lachnospiraceae oral taxon 107 str. F0167]|nr:hypothetical protein HMPREF0491_01084 [Lachnospiraceae oral taxon 107 str. F0167]